MFKLNSVIIYLFILSSCSYHIVSVQNERAGELNATYTLDISAEKKFPLDDYTAPKSLYMQICHDSVGKRQLALLNSYRNSIYFYNYETGDFIREIRFEKEGPNGILSLNGFYVKNMDSIYIYSKPKVELLLGDCKGHVKQRWSLMGKGKDWYLSMPQYLPGTVCPMVEMDNHLILTGFSPFCIENDDMKNFRFTACMDLENGQLDFHHLYPMELFEGNANWDDPCFMKVYPCIAADGSIIHSFPISHNVYVSKWDSDEARTVYAGSNAARTIRSIDWDYVSQHTPRELIHTHILRQDLYAAMLYDPWRKAYYRFMQQGIKGATSQDQLTEKPVVVIMMDEQFNYLGEIVLGTSNVWNWNNSFVTKEGLNIEYIDESDIDEQYMRFKICVPQKIN